MKKTAAAFLTLSLFLITGSFTQTAKSRNLIRIVDAKTNYNIKPRFFKKTPFVVNRGSHLYIGKTGDYDKESIITLVDISSGKKIMKPVPMDDFFRQNSSLLINGEFYEQSRYKRRKKTKAWGLNKFLFYDEANGSAGLLVRNNQRIAGITVYRFIYLHWDLASNSISRGHIIAEYGANRKEPFYTYYTPYPVGYESETDTFYLAIFKTRYYRRRTNYKRGQMTIEAFLKKSRRKITSFTTQLHPAKKFRFHRESQTAFFAQYAEKPYRIKPKGYFINLNDGSLKTCPVPGTAYGQAFSPDGEKIYLASNQTGYLWVIDTTSGRVLKKIFAGVKGHALGFVKKDTLLWIRHAGLQFINTRTMRRGAFISMKKYMKGFIHIEGSLVAPGLAIVNNGGMLHFIKVK